jgi:hypothetical protein
MVEPTPVTISKTPQEKLAKKLAILSVLLIVAGFGLATAGFLAHVGAQPPSTPVPVWGVPMAIFGLILIVAGVGAYIASAIIR